MNLQVVLRPSAWITAASTLLFLVACGPDIPLERPQESGSGLGVDLVRIPPRVRRACTAERVPCPCLIPSTGQEFKAHVSHAVATPNYRSVDVSIGAPTERLSPRNAPPHFLHIQTFAGHLSREGGLIALNGAVRRLRLEESPPKRSNASLLLGTEDWGGRNGQVFLAPPYPFGGVESDHLLFVWKGKDGELAVSLHAWLPLSASLKTLEEVIDALPPSEDSMRCA